MYLLEPVILFGYANQSLIGMLKKKTKQELFILKGLLYNFYFNFYHEIIFIQIKSTYT